MNRLTRIESSRFIRDKAVGHWVLGSRLSMKANSMGALGPYKRANTGPIVSCLTASIENWNSWCLARFIVHSKFICYILGFTNFSPGFPLFTFKLVQESRNYCIAIALLLVEFVRIRV